MRETRKEINGYVTLSPRLSHSSGALNFTAMYNDEKRELIYYGECHHIFSDDITNDSCIKRYFDINDPLTDLNIRLVICNEHFRLMVREHKHKNKKEFVSEYHETDSYIDVLKNIIREYIGSKYKFETYQYSYNMFNCGGIGTVINPLVSYPICSRPYIYKYALLYDLIDFMINKGNYYNSEIIFDCIKRALIGVSQHLLKYAKYKYYHDDINKAIGRLAGERYMTDSRDRYDPVNYTSLMTILFELQTKINTNH